MKTGFNIQFPISNFHSSLEQPRRGRTWVFMFVLALGTVLAQAQTEPVDARAAFNAGLAAFAANNYTNAIRYFKDASDAATAAQLDPNIAKHNARLAATKAKDLIKASEYASPQKRADEFYNCGNIEYKLANGTTNTPPINAINLDEQLVHINKAIENYAKAIEYDPKREDAKANYELAVLKQQQIQEQKQQQQKQEQQKQDQQNQDQQNQKQEDQQNPQQEQQKQEQPQAEPQPRPETQSAQEEQKQEEPIKEDKPSEEMTPEEAALMLDAMKAQEQSQRDRLHPFFGRPVPVEKDW